MSKIYHIKLLEQQTLDFVASMFLDMVHDFGNPDKVQDVISQAYAEILTFGHPTSSPKDLQDLYTKREECVKMFDQMMSHVPRINTDVYRPGKNMHAVLDQSCLFSECEDINFIKTPGTMFDTGAVNINCGGGIATTDDNYEYGGLRYFNINDPKYTNATKNIPAFPCPVYNKFPAKFTIVLTGVQAPIGRFRLLEIEYSKNKFGFWRTIIHTPFRALRFASTGQQNATRLLVKYHSIIARKWEEDNEYARNLTIALFTEMLCKFCGDFGQLLCAMVASFDRQICGFPIKILTNDTYFQDISLCMGVSVIKTARIKIDEFKTIEKLCVESPRIAIPSISISTSDKIDEYLSGI